jgi:putative beta-lysine N-acetyltransferase
MKEFREGRIMADKVDTIGQGSVIQHGKFNDRIYLMNLAMSDCPGILDLLRELAREQRYKKIVARIPSSAAPYFYSDGYIMEAFVPGFYKRREAAFFVSKYLDSDRLMEIEQSRLDELGTLLEEAKINQVVEPVHTKEANKMKLRALDKTHVNEVARIYREVFKSYPFPIDNPDYIMKTMNEDVRYFGVEKDGTLIALASTEIDRAGSNAEMTDFATLPGYRGNHLATLLLTAMEDKMKKAGIRTLFTIARLNSPAMNKTFIRQRYTYSGTLVKNTNIAGNIESMNVYYKHL